MMIAICNFRCCFSFTSLSTPQTRVVILMFCVAVALMISCSSVTVQAQPVKKEFSIEIQTIDGNIIIAESSAHKNHNGRFVRRNALTGEADLWPKGVVPFVIDQSLQKQRRNILQAMNNYHQNSCVRFVRYTGQEDYINITNANRGCSSRVGRIGGQQTVSLSGEHCFYVGTIVHELGHVLGFEHEHQRLDRDEYVVIDEEVLLTKVKKDDLHNFDYKPNAINMTKYDYNSIMHYGSYWMKPTMKGAKLVDPHYKYGLGQLDIETVNIIYKCTSYIK